MVSSICNAKRFRYHVTFNDERGHAMYIAHSEISLDDAKEHGKAQLRQMANMSHLFNAIVGKGAEKPQIKFMEIAAEVSA